MMLRSTRDDLDAREWIYDFVGLRLKTDGIGCALEDRVLPLGEACGLQMEYLARNPDIVAGKRVLEVFRGAGPIGLAAVHLGIARVTRVERKAQPPGLACCRAHRDEGEPPLRLFCQPHCLLSCDHWYGLSGPNTKACPEPLLPR